MFDRLFTSFVLCLIPLTQRNLVNVDTIPVALRKVSDQELAGCGKTNLSQSII